MTTYILPMLVFAAIGLAAGILLTVCSKIFEVKVDERVEAISEALPQVNCGACGFSGCSDYANAIVNSGAELNMCKPGGNDCAKKIKELYFFLFRQYRGNHRRSKHSHEEKYAV